jgi:hypothetical protein
MRRTSGFATIILLSACLSATAKLPPPNSKVPPGTLARDRLGPIAVGILTGADRVEVEVGSWQRSHYGEFEPLAKEKDLDARFAARITALLMKDRAYTCDMFDASWVDPVMILRFWKVEEEATVMIVPNGGFFSVDWWSPNGHQQYRVGLRGALAPIAKQLRQLLQEAYPNGLPEVPPTGSSMKQDPNAFLKNGTIGVLPESMKSLRADDPLLKLPALKAIVPGITREELMAFCTTEGGISSRYGRTYRIKGVPFTAKGFLKIGVTYAAPQQKIMWLNGSGYILERDSQYGLPHEEQPNDIAIRISPPFYGWDIID